MRTRFFAALVALAPLAPPARAAVVVIGNYTDTAIPFTLAEPDAKPRAHKLGENEVAAFTVAGPADLTFTAKGKPHVLRLDPYNAFVFLPDKDAGARLEGLEQPGEPLDRDTRPELNGAKRDPVVKVPVTMYVDDAEPRAEALWKKELRARFDEVAAALEKGTGVRLELVGFDSWKSDPNATTTTDLLKSFEAAVPVKAGSLAVGYSSRKLDDKIDPTFGASRGLAGRHILLREPRPKNEPERVEVLLHHVARALGGVGTPDPGSALRAKQGDGYILRAGAVLRLDPLNALALNIWADERRTDAGATLGTITPVARHRLTRAYKALLKAAPGDALALSYLNDLGADVAKQLDPMPKNPDRPPVKLGAREDLTRFVIKAIVDRAKANTGPAALAGDELTAAYVKAASNAAVVREGPEMIPAFLIGLGVALDDGTTLADDATTAAAVKDLETADERKARLAVLGNPTFAGRRDLCRRFFVGCATAELLPEATAEKVAIGRAIFDLHTRAGFCETVLAAELTGITFSRACFRDAEIVRDSAHRFPADMYLPALTGLRNGTGPEKFEELYGDTADKRFLALVADVRKRAKDLKAYK